MGHDEGARELGAREVGAREVGDGRIGEGGSGAAFPGNRIACVIAALVAMAGLTLRQIVPVTPPDEAYRAVVEAYPAKPLP